MHMVSHSRITTRALCACAGAAIAGLLLSVSGCGLYGVPQTSPYILEPSEFASSELVYVDVEGIAQLVLEVEAPDEYGRSYRGILRSRSDGSSYLSWASFLGVFRNRVPYQISVLAIEEIGAGLAVLVMELETDPPPDQPDWMRVRTCIVDLVSGRLYHVDPETFPMLDVQSLRWTDREQAIRRTFVARDSGDVYFGSGAAGSIEKIYRADLYEDGRVDLHLLVDRSAPIVSFSANAAGTITYVEDNASLGRVLRYRTADGSAGDLTDQLPANHSAQRVFVDESGIVYVASRLTAGNAESLSVIGSVSGSPTLEATATPVASDARFSDATLFHTPEKLVFAHGSGATMVEPGGVVTTVSWSNGGHDAVVLKDDRYVFGTRTTIGTEGIAFVADIQTGWSRQFSLSGDRFSFAEMRDLPVAKGDEVLLVVFDGHAPGYILFYHLTIGGSQRFYFGDNDGERYASAVTLP